MVSSTTLIRETERMVFDYTQDEMTLLIGLIRRDNGDKPLTLGQATFGQPNVNIPTPDHDRDTVIVANSILGKGYKGRQTFYYNRVPLDEFVDWRIPDKSIFPMTTETMMSDLLPAINAKWSTNIQPDKILNIPLPSVGGVDGLASVRLTAAPNSLVYEKFVDIWVIPPVIPLYVELPNTDLDGLSYT